MGNDYSLHSADDRQLTSIGSTLSEVWYHTNEQLGITPWLDIERDVHSFLSKFSTERLELLSRAIRDGRTVRHRYLVIERQQRRNP